MHHRLHSLDGLRAVAACLVVAHHIGVNAVASGLAAHGHESSGRLVGGLTASGVDLFFVLSAIVLARPYILDARPMRLGSYALRRVERLWPPFVAAWLLAGAAVYLGSRFPTWQTAAADRPLFEVVNWLLQLAIVYFGTQPFNVTWWSLGVEVSFYVFLPLLIALFARVHRDRGWLAFAFLLCAAASISALAGVDVPSLQRSLVIFSPCFCAGLILACWQPPRKLAMSLTAMGALWVLASSESPVLDQHLGWALFYFGVVATALDRTSSLNHLFSGYSFVWLGERSYSLFLVHNSLIVLSYHAVSMALPHGPAYLVLSRTLALVATLVGTILVFNFVERPFARNLATGGDLLPRWAHKLRTASGTPGA